MNAWPRREHQSSLLQSSHLLPLMQGSSGDPHAEGDTSKVLVEEEQLVI